MEFGIFNFILCTLSDIFAVHRYILTFIYNVLTMK